MKKNLNKIIIGIALTLGFASCDLDKFPLAALSPETYFSNGEELRLYSNKFYEDILPGATSMYSDMGDAIIVTPLNIEISGQRVVPATGGGWSWSALRRINYLLENSLRLAERMFIDEINDCKAEKLKDSAPLKVPN